MYCLKRQWVCKELRGVDQTVEIKTTWNEVVLPVSLCGAEDFKMKRGFDHVNWW